MKTFYAVLLAVWVLFAQPASAEVGGPKSVQDFVEACKKDSPWYVYCSGLIQGISYVVGMNGKMGVGAQACLPEEFTAIPLKIEVFINWARANPTARQETGEVGMMIAIAKKWPCAN